MIQAEDKKADIHWKWFNNSLVYTMASVQWALSKYKPATLSVSIEEKPKRFIFKLLQREQFGEEIGALPAEKTEHKR